MIALGRAPAHKRRRDEPILRPPEIESFGADRRSSGSSLLLPFRSALAKHASTGFMGVRCCTSMAWFARFGRGDGANEARFAQLLQRASERTRTSGHGRSLRSRRWLRGPLGDGAAPRTEPRFNSALRRARTSGSSTFASCTSMAACPLDSAEVTIRDAGSSHSRTAACRDRLQSRRFVRGPRRGLPSHAIRQR